MITKETITIAAKPGVGGVSLTNKPQPKAEEKPKEEAPKGEEKKQTDEEIEQRRKEVAQSMGWEKPEAKPIEKPKAEPKKEEKPVEEKPKEEAGPVAEKPKEEKPEQPAEGDDQRTERLISKTAKETATAVTDALKPKPEEKPEAAAPELNAEDQQIYKQLQFIEKNDPKAKGKAEEFAKFAQDRYAYQAKWEKENKGKEFDVDSPEHEEFFAKQPDIDEAELERAETDMRVDARVKEKLDAELGPQREKEAAAERAAAFKEAMPVIVEQVNKSVVKLVEALDPKLAGHLKDEKGNIVLSQANGDKLADADPIASEVLTPLVFDELVPMLLELEKTTVKALNHTLDPRANPVHARIASYIAEYERDVAAGPAEVRTRADGATFVTVSGKNRMVDAANANKDAKQRAAELKRIEDDHFTVTIDDLEEYILDDISARAQKKYERLDGGAKKKYGSAAAKNGAGEPKPAPAKEEEAAPVIETPRRQHRPPSVSSQSDVVNVTGAPAGGEKKLGEVMAETAFGK